MVLWGYGLFACLDASILSDKLCDDLGRCLSGYHCDQATNRCVPLGEAGDGGGSDGDGVDSDLGDAQVQVPAPIVLYSFSRVPAPPMVPDDSDLYPNVALRAADREPLGIEFEEGVVHFSGGRLEADQKTTQRLSETLIQAESFTIEFWTATTVLEQPDYRRIVTISSGNSSRSITLGQNNTSLFVWLRTSATKQNGTDHEQMVKVFDQAGVFYHIVFTYSADTGAAILYIDAVLGSMNMHLVGGGQPAILNWDLEQNQLGLGDEFGVSRSWTGTLHKVALYDQALGPEQIQWLYQLGPQDIQ